MNIKITYNWLLDYLETDADPYEMQKYLSLCGPSIETVEKIEDDYVFDIEITSNRIDMASVFGIAQEAQAILPQFGKKAQLKHNPLEEYTFEHVNLDASSSKEVDVEIRDPELVSRFTAMVFTDIHVKPISEIIQKRLKLSGIKSINNVIDISNYLMLSLGQPTHMFDYDRIADHTMIVRTSTKGETLTTLDGKKIILPGDDIVIEDGSGKLIDLCGIMGGENSSITEHTKNVILFVQTYDKKRIRKTSMLTGQRTLAATYFEKGLDPARVEPAFVYGIKLLTELAHGRPASKLIDIYPHPHQVKKIKVYLKDIHRVMGITIDEKKVISILENLGFAVNRFEDDELAYPDGVSFEVMVPTYRTDDVEIKEDIIEEIARVYGYHNLPNNISPLVYVKQPPEIESLFKMQYKSKYYLKHLGLHEVLNYSMISADLITALDMKLSDHLKIANTISQDIEYMRISLIPSLMQNIKHNSGKRDELKLFEIAKVYLKQGQDLPDEQYKLAIAVNTDFFDLKGIVEALLRTFNIDGCSFMPSQSKQFATGIQAALIDDSSQKQIGVMGMLASEYQEKLGIKEPVFVTEIDFSFLMTNVKTVTSYQEPLQYAIIKLDLTIDTKNIPYAKLSENAFQTSPLLQKVELIDRYQENITVRFYFASAEKNITEKEAKVELKQIQNNISS